MARLYILFGRWEALENILRSLTSSVNGFAFYPEGTGTYCREWPELQRAGEIKICE